MAKKLRRIVTTQSEVAAHFGVSRRTIADWVASGMPRRDGRYDLDEIEGWRSARIPDDTDPLLSGPGTSPALERYREARAKLAELDLEQRRGRLVDIGDLRERISMLASHLRKAAERIERLHGPDPKRILDEALDEVERGNFADNDGNSNSAAGG